MRDYENEPMPWCEHCQCYHHEPAPHITRHIEIASLADWFEFLCNNGTALQDAGLLPSGALDMAIDGGLMLGGGAVPLTVVTIAPELAPRIKPALECGGSWH